MTGDRTFAVEDPATLEVIDSVADQGAAKRQRRSTVQHRRSPTGPVCPLAIAPMSCDARTS